MERVNEVKAVQNQSRHWCITRLFAITNTMPFAVSHGQQSIIAKTSHLPFGMDLQSSLLLTDRSNAQTHMDASDLRLGFQRSHAETKVVSDVVLSASWKWASEHRHVSVGQKPIDKIG